MTTLHEASKCMKCGLTGKEGKTLPTQEYGKRVVMYWCMNEVCEWYNTSWPVQINPDGSIPEPNTTGGAKQFTVVGLTEAALAIERANQIADALNVMPRGGEIRGRG